MTDLSTVDEILAFAIENEEKAYDFYLQLAAATEAEAIKETLRGFAAEELGHKRQLEEIRDGKVAARWVPQKVQDLKIADYLADVKLEPGLDFQEALIVAMKQELIAMKLYEDLALAAGPSPLADVFRGLAQEEAKHKLRFEIVYDEGILAED